MTSHLDHFTLAPSRENLDQSEFLSLRVIKRIEPNVGNLLYKYPPSFFLFSYFPRLIVTSTLPMDTKNENVKVRDTPEWAQYQRHNFWLANESQVPVFNTGTSLLDFRSIHKHD